MLSRLTTAVKLHHRFECIPGAFWPTGKIRRIDLIKVFKWILMDFGSAGVMAWAQPGSWLDSGVGSWVHGLVRALSGSCGELSRERKRRVLVVYVNTPEKSCAIVESAFRLDYIRLFAFSRRPGAQPAARIPKLRTDFGRPRSQPQ